MGLLKLRFRYLLGSNTLRFFVNVSCCPKRNYCSSTIAVKNMCHRFMFVDIYWCEFMMNVTTNWVSSLPSPTVTMCIELLHVSRM